MTPGEILKLHTYVIGDIPNENTARLARLSCLLNEDLIKINEVLARVRSELVRRAMSTAPENKEEQNAEPTDR